MLILTVIGISSYGQSTGGGGGGSTTPMAPSSGGGSGGGDVFQASNNVFSAVNTFNAAETNNGPLVTSNLTVRGVFINKTLTYPGSDGTSNQVLSTDGAGNLSFATVSSSGGGNVFTASNNTFVAARTNLFNGGFIVNNLIDAPNGSLIDGSSETLNWITRQFSNKWTFNSALEVDGNMSALGAFTNNGGMFLSNVTVRGPQVLFGSAVTFTNNGTTVVSNLTVLSSFNASGATNINASSITSGTVPMVNINSTILTNVATTGSGTSLVSSVSTRVALLKSLLPGTGITITDGGGTNLTIASTVTGGGDIFSASNNTFTAINTFNGVETNNAPMVTSNLTVIGLASFTSNAIFSGVMTSNTGNATITGTLQVPTITSVGSSSVTIGTNLTIGTFAGNTVTMVAGTMSVPAGGWNVGSSAFVISNSNIGILEAAPTNTIQIDGTSGRQILMGAAAQFVNGNSLTVKAGSVNATASTNLTGGTLVLQGGNASGTASSAVEIDVASVGGSGTAVHQPAQAAVFKNTGTVLGAYASPSGFVDIGASTLSQADALRITMGVSSTGNILGISTNGIMRLAMTTGDIMVSNANWTTPISTAPVINQIFTNTQRRGYINADILFSDTTGLARAKLIQVTGTTTNVLSDRQASGAVNADILGINGYINPGSILCFSNFSTGDGTVSITNFISVGF